MLSLLDKIIIENHKILGNQCIDLVNKETGKPYKIVVFVGENGSGKTTILNELAKFENHRHIYIRQNSMLVGLYNEVAPLLVGQKAIIKSHNFEDSADGKSDNISRPNNTIDSKQKDLELLKDLEDQTIVDAISNNSIEKMIFSSRMMEFLVGKREGFKLEELSSGQQEILIKLRELRQMHEAIDYVLMDEPEASLHPRWQLKIVQLIEALLADGNSDAPQIFIATHSEKVLESLINDHDVLIVRLFKINGTIKNETINQMDLRLPKTTFAELDYVVFNIDSFEYCSQLYDLIEWKTGEGERLIDKRIRSNESYNEQIHQKDWYNAKYKNFTAHNVATYCRNYFHHPKDREKPTSKQLHDAIELLRNVVLNLE